MSVRGPARGSSFSRCRCCSRKLASGFSSKKINAHPGWSKVNFKSATGIGVSLRQNGIRSRCQSLNQYAYALNNPTLVDPLGLQGGDPCDRNPNRVICGNDAVHLGPPPGAGLFGLSEFDLAQMGFLPGSGLPSGICPAQFQFCTVFPNGTIIGKGTSGFTAFTFGQAVNGAGSPCSARDVEAGECSVSGMNVTGVSDFNPQGPSIGPAPPQQTAAIGRSLLPSCGSILLGGIVPPFQLTPSDAAVSAAASSASAYAFNEGLQHAASRGLTYSLKSSIFRFLVGLSEDLAFLAEFSPYAIATAELAPNIIKVAQARIRGGCKPGF